MEIVYQEHTIKEVTDFFAKSFDPKPDGKKVIKADAFVDAGKQVIIFKLFVDTPPDNRPG